MKEELYLATHMRAVTSRLGFAVAACILMILGAIAFVSAADQSRDTVTIQLLESRQADAWNQHDAKAYASLFTDDADVVNVLGWWWKGRTELEDKLGAAFASVFQASRLTITNVDVRFPTPDVAIAHVRWTMTGAENPTGGPDSHAPMIGIQTQVLRRASGTWLISAFQNTNSIPETPFPPPPR